MSIEDTTHTGACHCGAVEITIPRAPETATNCNCSICRRYGTLWAYFPATEVRWRGHPERTSRYIWGDKMLGFVRCTNCGCVMAWELLEDKPDARTGVNLRNFAPDTLGSYRIRLFDGANTWKAIGEAQHVAGGFALAPSG